MSQLFENFINWYLLHTNYGTVFFLMAIESSFIPFPSEVVIPPAAFKAAQGHLNIYLVMLSGGLGAITGALFNYYIALFLGRNIIYRLAGTRWAHMLLINEKSVAKAEEYFRKYGNISTLIGRLVPVVRQLISLPAGFAKMKIRNFIIYTLIGSTLWNVILAALGYFLYSQKELLDRYYRQISIVFIAAGILFTVYLILKSLQKKSRPSVS